PMQGRVAENKIGFACWVETADILAFPFERRIILPGFLQHLFGAVDSGNDRFLPALREKRGDMARPTSEIINKGWRGQRNLREQVERRTEAVIGEQVILFRIPCHCALLLLFSL